MRYYYDSANNILVPISSGHEIVDSSGTVMTQRKNLVFENADVTDDSTNNATIVTPKGTPIFKGTTAEWNALTTAQKAVYADGQVLITDDTDYVGNITDAITKGNMSAVTSNAVYNGMQSLVYHNIPRLIPKDITSYMTDGTFYKRLNGTDGYMLFEDIFVGDYVHMSRAITAPNQDSQYATTGSDYVTIIGLDTKMGDGDGGGSVGVINYHHAVFTAGQGFGGTQHFGRKRMNGTNTTVGGYVASEMHTDTLGAVVSSGSTASGATINQQLYAEFGSHLKTTRELLTNAIKADGYNRFGVDSGCSSGWAWTTCQAVLMSEIEVYGSVVLSSSGYDTGNANKQMPLFAHNKQAMNNRNGWYWLKDIASGAYFCVCHYFGYSDYLGASDANFYVRPRFILA